MKLLAKVVGLAVVLAVCFGFGFSWRDLRRGALPKPDTVRALITRSDTEDVVAAKVFRRHYESLLTDYVSPLDASDLKWSAMEGMFAAVGDPHTMFLRPRAAEDFHTETSAQLVGVGARLAGDELGARVATVFEDSPAIKAGLMQNDVITSVDDVPVVGSSVENIVDRIRGVEGTYVKLQVSRPGKDKPIVMTIRRAQITVPTVEGTYLSDDHVGVLRMQSFSQPTARQFASSLNKLEQNKLKGLVIDLRDDPGGLLETTIELLSLFLDDKVVVTVEMRDGQRHVVRTNSGDVRQMPYPIVILINEDSASASEIFAGVLHDYSRATLVGTHSYGKASVQDVHRLVDGSSAKITIGRYLLPTSGDIGRKVDEDGMYLSGGLTPDVEVKLPMDQPVLYGDPKTDPQLRAAVEIIRKKEVSF